MKILHVIASVDPRHGGPIDSIKSLSAVWSREGHLCQVASLDVPGDPWTRGLPLKVFTLGHPTFRAVPLGSYGYSPRFVRWLCRHAVDYDAVLVHGLWNYASFGSWRALHGSGTPYFVFTHGMLDPYFNRAFPLKAIYKSIFWRLFEHKVLRDSRAVLFTTREERDLAAQSFHPYAVRPAVVGLGTRDLDNCNLMAEQRAFAAVLPQLRGRRFLLFLSRIHPKKGIDLLIHAFARQAAAFPDLDLVIAGPDQVGLEKELRALADNLKLGPRIHWPGMLTGDSKWGAFRAAEFFVLPSHQENFGIAVSEALAVGTPVLITNKVNIWVEIEEDGAGIVVSDDIAGVSWGVERACAAMGAERSIMAARARACFVRRYDIETIAGTLLGLIESPQSPTRNSPEPTGDG